jgi:iron complex outermembrane receptor protein
MIWSRGSACFAFVTILCINILSFGSTAHADPVTVEVPPQPLASALREFARQTGIQVGIPATLTDGKMSVAVKGSFEPADALNRLLKGSGLVAYPVNRKTYGIRSESSAGRPHSLSAIPPADSVSINPNQSRLKPMNQSDAEGPSSKEDISGLAEIVVTAQKRAERLQDVPIAISALTGETMERLGITNIEDLSQHVPSLTYTELSPGQYSIALRGITQDLGLAPTVGYYFDETPFDLRSDIYAGAPGIEMYDIDRVEVLRGPQGTLYGGGSMGGLIRLIPKSPDPTGFYASTETDVALNEAGRPNYGIKAAVNMPLNSDSALRVVATYRDIGGYLDQAAPSSYFTIPANPAVVRRNFNTSDIYSIRASMLWAPDSGWEIKPSLIYQHSGANGYNAYYAGTKNHVAIENFIDSNENDLAIGSLTVKKNFAFAALTNNTSYFYKRSQSDSDYSVFGSELYYEFTGSTTGNFPVLSARPLQYHAITEELRLASNDAPSWLRWIAGGFYEHINNAQGQFVSSNSLGPFVAGVFGVPPSSNLVAYTGTVTDEQYAGFGEVTLVPLKGFDLTAGVRAYQFDEDVTSEVGGLLGSGPSPEIYSHKTGVDPKFTASYRVSDSVNVYTTASKGFRAGGPNGAVLGGDCNLSLYSPTYQPDSVWSYEGGVKTHFLNGRATLNVAAYRIDWTNIQGNISTTCGDFTENYGNARINGGEAEWSLRPMTGLEISGTLSLNNARFTSLNPGYAAATPVQVGDRVVDVPRTQAA